MMFFVGKQNYATTALVTFNKREGLKGLLRYIYVGCLFVPIIFMEK